MGCESRLQAQNDPSVMKQAPEGGRGVRLCACWLLHRLAHGEYLSQWTEHYCRSLEKVLNAGICNTFRGAAKAKDFKVRSETAMVALGARASGRVKARRFDHVSAVSGKEAPKEALPSNRIVKIEQGSKKGRRRPASAASTVQGQ